jgi:NADPH:quinone reductase
MNLLALMAKRGTVHGSTLRSRPLEAKAAAAQAVRAQVLPLLARARLQVPLVATYRLQDAEQAYERFAAGTKFGKIVLVSSED